MGSFHPGSAFIRQRYSSSRSPHFVGPSLFSYLPTTSLPAQRQRTWPCASSSSPSTSASGSSNSASRGENRRQSLPSTPPSALSSKPAEYPLFPLRPTDEVARVSTQRQSAAGGQASRGGSVGASVVSSRGHALDVDSDEEGGHVGPAYGLEDLQRMEVSERVQPARAGASPASAPAGTPKRLAAVDLGTNSFHMVVVKADAKGNFEIEDVEKEDVRLGSGSAGFSVITPEAEDRAVAALKRLKKIAQAGQATMRVVATSAVREARNRRAFVRRLYDVTGVDVEVLSGREEACLIYLGILQALPVYHRTVLTVDIGGGSTEFVIGRRGQPLLATSLKLGHIRLTERFASAAVLSKAALDDMRRCIRVLLNDSGVVEAVRSMQGEIELAIGSSGTIETLEHMISLTASPPSGSAAQPGVNGSSLAWAYGAQLSRSGPAGGGASASQVGGSLSQAALESRQWGFKEREFTREQLSAIVKKICKAKTAEARAKIPGLPEKRADVIVGGAILLEEIFLALGIDKMRVSPYALREGVIVDTLARTCEDFAITTDLRRSSVMNLATKFNTERRLDSALHSAELAKQILAGLLTCKTGGMDCVSDAMRQLDSADFEILEAATILHFVGMFISHKGYHKHSHYLIKNSEQLLGYSPIEVEMIALLARYHRKKFPSLKDLDFEKLPENIQSKLRVLVSIIRIAVALDRCDEGAVERVLVLQDNESCVLAVTPSHDPGTGTLKDVSLEMWAARAELDYFQKIFKKIASIVLIDDLDAESIDVERSESLSS